MRFPSKRDFWLTAIVLAGEALILGGVAFALASPKAPGWPFAAFLLVAAAAVAWVFFAISYEITKEQLVARCGPFRFRVPLDAILRVLPSGSRLSAPAASLDRLKVVFTRKGQETYLLISPRDKEAFLQALSEASPGLAAPPPDLVAAAQDAERLAGADDDATVH